MTRNIEELKAFGISLAIFLARIFVWLVFLFWGWALQDLAYTIRSPQWLMGTGRDIPGLLEQLFKSITTPDWVVEIVDVMFRISRPIDVVIIAASIFTIVVVLRRPRWFTRWKEWSREQDPWWIYFYNSAKSIVAPLAVGWIVGWVSYIALLVLDQHGMLYWP